MGDETLEDGISVAAPFILTVVFAFHFFPWYFGRSFKPSTFAQAAKLRRLAASKEEELMKKQEAVGQDIKDSQQTLLFIIKLITYFILVCWFWRIPVSSMSRHLIQPFGWYRTLASLVYEGQ